MKTEIERLYEDRSQAEQELFELEEELNAHEREYGHDNDEWESLHHEVNEKENEVAYINSWIQSHEQGYEE